MDWDIKIHESFFIFDSLLREEKCLKSLIILTSWDLLWWMIKIKLIVLLHVWGNVNTNPSPQDLQQMLYYILIPSNTRVRLSGLVQSVRNIE